MTRRLSPPSAWLSACTAPRPFWNASPPISAPISAGATLAAALAGLAVTAACTTITALTPVTALTAATLAVTAFGQTSLTNAEPSVASENMTPSTSTTSNTTLNTYAEADGKEEPSLPATRPSEEAERRAGVKDMNQIEERRDVA